MDLDTVVGVDHGVVLHQRAGGRFVQVDALGGAAPLGWRLAVGGAAAACHGVAADGNVAAGPGVDAGAVVELAARAVDKVALHLAVAAHAHADVAAVDDGVAADDRTHARGDGGVGGHGQRRGEFAVHAHGAVAHHAVAQGQVRRRRLQVGVTLNRVGPGAKQVAALDQQRLAAAGLDADADRVFNPQAAQLHRCA